MHIPHDQIGKWVKSGLTIAAIAVAWVQGSTEPRLDWLSIFAFLNGGVLITIIVLLIRIGAWQGKVDQRFEDLKERVDDIDKLGCGAAKRYHRNESDEE